MARRLACSTFLLLQFATVGGSAAGGCGEVGVATCSSAVPQAVGGPLGGRDRVGGYGGGDPGLVLLAKAFSLSRQLSSGRAPASSQLASLRHERPRAVDLLQRVRGLAESRLERVAQGNGTGNGTVDAPDEETTAIQEILSLMEDEIVSEMKQEHESDQTVIYLHVGYIQKCGQDLHSSTEHMDTLSKNVSKAEDKEQTCTEELGVKKQAAENSCDHAHSFAGQNLTLTTGCILGDSREPDAIAAYIACVEHEFAADLDHAKFLHGSCNQSTSEYRAKTIECKEARDVLEESSCKLQRASALACSTYDGCYQREVSRYGDIKTQILPAEEGRKVQAVAVEKITCLLTDILQVSAADLAEDGHARLEKCDALGGEDAAESFVVEYPAPENAIVCPWKSLAEGTSGLQCSEEEEPTELKEVVASTTPLSATTTTATTTLSATGCAGGHPAAGVVRAGHVVACNASFTGHVKDQDGLCAPGWHVCSGEDVYSRFAITSAEAQAPASCFVYNSMNDCHGCWAYCGDDAPSLKSNGCHDSGCGHDLAAMGSACHVYSGAGDCIAGARFNNKGYTGCGCEVHSVPAGGGVVCCVDQ